ncbi:MAG: hypothetical protein ABI233_00730 [Chthoniobacterales bacterium]
MEKFSFRRGALPLLCLALLFAGCGKKKETAAATPTPTPSASPASHAGPTPAPPLRGQVTPAVITQDANSISHYLHFPENPAAAKRDSVVQFYCDVTDEGIVEATYGLVGQDEAFKAAVQTALDWGRFAPATVDGKPVPVYLGGTVIFTHDKGQPVIAISLATHDRERVGKLVNFIQPQLVGGLRADVAKIIRLIPHNFPANGIAQAVVEVDAKGVLKSTKIVGESPKGSGLGDLLDAAIKGAQYTHAYDNGKAAGGALDVVADFGKL